MLINSQFKVSNPFTEEVNQLLATELNLSCKAERILSNDQLDFPFLYGKYAFISTPIDPENDIHLVLDTFLKFSEYPIVVCSSWYKNSYADAVYSKFHQYRFIHFLNDDIDQRTYNMLRTNCYVYIDSQHQSDKNNSLLEAMYMQLPVIAFASSYNIKLTSNKAMYYKMPTELLAALKSLHPAKAAKIGANMKEIIHHKIKNNQKKPKNQLATEQLRLQPVKH